MCYQTEKIKIILVTFLKIFKDLDTYIDKSKKMFIGRKEVGSNVLFQLGCVSTLKKIKD